MIPNYHTLACTLLSKGIRLKEVKSKTPLLAYVPYPSNELQSRQTSACIIWWDAHYCDIHVNTRLTASSHFVIACPMRPITHQVNKWNCHSCPQQPRSHARMGTMLHSHINALHSLLHFSIYLFRNLCWRKCVLWHVWEYQLMCISNRL